MPKDMTELTRDVDPMALHDRGEDAKRRLEIARRLAEAGVPMTDIPIEDLSALEEMLENIEGEDETNPFELTPEDEIADGMLLMRNRARENEKDPNIFSNSSNSNVRSSGDETAKWQKGHELHKNRDTLFALVKAAMDAIEHPENVGAIKAKENLDAFLAEKDISSEEMVAAIAAASQKTEDQPPSFDDLDPNAIEPGSNEGKIRRLRDIRKAQVEEEPPDEPEEEPNPTEDVSDLLDRLENIVDAMGDSDVDPSLAAAATIVARRLLQRLGEMTMQSAGVEEPEDPTLEEELEGIPIPEEEEMMDRSNPRFYTRDEVLERGRLAEAAAGEVPMEEPPASPPVNPTQQPQAPTSPYDRWVQRVRQWSNSPFWKDIRSSFTEPGDQNITVTPAIRGSAKRIIRLAQTLEDKGLRIAPEILDECTLEILGANHSNYHKTAGRAGIINVFGNIPGEWKKGTYSFFGGGSFWRKGDEAKVLLVNNDDDSWTIHAFLFENPKDEAPLISKVAEHILPTEAFEILRDIGIPRETVPQKLLDKQRFGPDKFTEERNELDSIWNPPIPDEIHDADSKSPFTKVSDLLLESSKTRNVEANKYDLDELTDRLVEELRRSGLQSRGVAKKLDISQSTAKRILQSLENAGIVTRDQMAFHRKDGTGGRNVFWRLTDAYDNRTIDQSNGQPLENSTPDESAAMIEPFPEALPMVPPMATPMPAGSDFSHMNVAAEVDRWSKLLREADD